MPTVLVVDDRVVNREFLSTLIGYAGLEVLTAGDGAEALEAVRAHRPALVITDVLMPTMDGFEFANRLRQDPDPAISAVPIIFYTATYRLTEARELARACGVAKVLSKPSEPAEILAAVTEALGAEPVAVPAAAAAAGVVTSGALGDPLPEGGRGLVELERLLQRAASEAERAARPGPPAMPPGSGRLSPEGVHWLSLRLAAMLELGLVLASERDPERLMMLAARAARNIVSARFAVIALGLGPGRPRRWAVHGMSAEEEALVTGSLDPRGGVFGELLADGRARRLAGPAADAAALGLPAGHPPIRNLLAVRVASGSRTNGWIYVAGKLGAEAFGEDDEQLAATLAAQLAPAYESLVLLGEVERHADRLEREIAEREVQERRVARLTRVYAVLSGINSAIVRIHDRLELFQEACRVAVTKGEFAMAWVAVLDPGTLEGRVAAHAGGEPSDLDGVRISARADRPESARPASRALREGRRVVCNDVAADPALAPLEAELLARGHRSVAAFPLTVEGRVVAVLSLFGAEAGLFDEQELKLLDELAGDISFGLQYIDKEETLHYLAYYDGLTGLANGALFGDRLTQLLTGARNGESTVAVLVIDLDRFTRLNDTFGRHTGDALLRAVAERLDEALGDDAVLARISADTFAVAVAGLRHGTDAASVLHEKVFASLGRPFTVDDKEIPITARAGIAVYPDDGEDAATLFKNAEAALKRAQASGERALFYAPEINARAAEKLELESRLRRAIESGQFVLHYQPRIDAASGRVAGLEALLRWNVPEQGLIAPGHFIPLLEESGMILEVGRWALASALVDHCCWREAGLSPPPVAVNVSAIELRQPGFADAVGRALADSGAGTGALELEITESVIMDDVEATTEVLRRLADLGVAVAVDDFGTGHSSLAYLAKLPVQSLKIDRSFIATMTDDPDSTAIVHTVISLGRALDLQVVAEGVETEEQAKLLRLMRCDELQGFLFSRPMARGDVEAYLRSTRDSGREPPAAVRAG